MESYKARLVILGNHQVEEIDYTMTFAPMAKMVITQVFLATAVRNWEVHQMDNHNAFLRGDLQDKAYMKLLPKFHVSVPGKVCRLEKSLYGLQQTPRCWFVVLSSMLKVFEFQQSYSDYSLFSMRKGNIHLCVLVYVDDLIVAGDDTVTTQLFRAYLSKCFYIKDLGVLKYFLGVEVA